MTMVLVLSLVDGGSEHYFLFSGAAVWRVLPE